MNSLFKRRLYSASLVWPMITSSMSVWANFLGLMRCSCEGAQQVIQERDVELEHFHELDDAAIGDVEFTVEVEGARIGVRAVLGESSGS